MIAELASPAKRAFFKAVFVVLVTALAGISLASSGHIALAWIHPHWPGASWLAVMGVGALLAILQTRLAATASSRVPGAFAEGVLAARTAGPLVAYALRSAWLVLVALMLGALGPLLVETVIFPALVPRLTGMSEQQPAFFEYLALYLHPAYRSMLVTIVAVAVLLTAWIIASIFRHHRWANACAAGSAGFAVLWMLGAGWTWASAVGLVLGVVAFYRGKPGRKGKRADKRVVAAGVVTLVIVVAWGWATASTGGYLLKSGIVKRADETERFYERVKTVAEQQNAYAARISDALDDAAERVKETAEQQDDHAGRISGTADNVTEPAIAFRTPENATGRAPARRVLTALHYSASALGGQYDRCPRADELAQGADPLDVVRHPELAIRTTADFYRFTRECRRGKAARDAGMQAAAVAPVPPVAAGAPGAIENGKLPKMSRPGWLEAIPSLWAVKGGESAEEPGWIMQSWGALLVGMWVFFSFFSLGQASAGPIYATERRRTLLIGGSAAILLAFALFAWGELALVRTFGPLRDGLWADYYAGSMIPPDIIGAMTMLRGENFQLILWMSAIWTVAFMALFITFIETIRRSIDDLMAWFKVGLPIRLGVILLCIASVVAGAWLSATSGALAVQLGIFAIMAVVQTIIITLACHAIWKARPATLPKDNIGYVAALYVAIVVVAVTGHFFGSEPALPNADTGNQLPYAATGDQVAAFAAILSVIAGALGALLYSFRNQSIERVSRAAANSGQGEVEAVDQVAPPQLRLLITQGLFGSEAAFGGALQIAADKKVDALIVLGPLHARSIRLYEELGGKEYRAHSLTLADDAPGCASTLEDIPAASMEARRKEDANLDTYSFGADAALLARITQSQGCWTAFLGELGREVAQSWQRIADRHPDIPVLFADVPDVPGPLSAAATKALGGSPQRMILPGTTGRVGNFDLTIGIESGGDANERGTLMAWRSPGRIDFVLGTQAQPPVKDAKLDRIPLPASAADGGGFRGLLLTLNGKRLDYLTVFQ